MGQNTGTTHLTCFLTILVWERALRSSLAPTDPNGMAGGEGGCFSPKLTWQSILDILNLNETQFSDIFYLFTQLQHELLNLKTQIVQKHIQ